MTAQTEAKTETSREPQVGDVVHVRAKVADVTASHFWIVDAECRQHPHRVADIVHIEPGPLKVGDRVTWGTRICAGELVAIRGEYGFVDMGGYAAKERLSNLTRINGGDRE